MISLEIVVTEKLEECFFDFPEVIIALGVFGPRCKMGVVIRVFDIMKIEIGARFWNSLMVFGTP